MNQSVNHFNQIHMPKIICGRGSISFAASLGRKRIAVLGYDNSVEALAGKIFANTEADVKYIATINHEPLVSDIYDNLANISEFEPDLILAVGGGSVMDVAKGLHLFYENPEMTFEDSLIPFSLPVLGKKAELIAVPTTSGTGSETSSAAVFIEEKSRVKKLLLSNTLIPHYAVLDADFTDNLPASIQIATGLDALCHAIESLTAKNANSFTQAIAMEAALDILEYLPTAVNADISEEMRALAKEKLHIAATMAGVAITNSFTGIVHSYDHPGPCFHIPHGIVCAIMLPYSMKLIGAAEPYAAIAKRLGYKGDAASLSGQLVSHLFQFNSRLGIPCTFKEKGISEAEYFENVPEWARISLLAKATELSPADMDEEKGRLFYKLCYYGDGQN